MPEPIKPPAPVSRPSQRTSLLATAAVAVGDEKARQEREQHAGAALRRVLATPEGRVALHWLMTDVCGVMEDVYVPGGAEAARHSDYNAGRRFPALEIIRVAGIRVDGLREFENGSGGEEEERPNRAREETTRRRQKGREAGQEN